MILAIVQARVGSTRLKDKMILELNGFKIIEWVLYRVKQSELINEYILAIPDTKENEILAEYGIKYGYEIYRGSENDVLARFFNSAKQYKSDLVIRICADNPCVASSELDILVDFFCGNNCDYAYNHVPKGNKYPDGLGGEIVSFNVLKRIYKKAIRPEHREHIFSFVWDNSDKFRICTFDPKDELLKHPELKLDIDTEYDYCWLKKLQVSRQMTAQEIVSKALSTPKNG
jgi:spore coat polysaccharide biosynthesis protein SpsF